MALPSSRARGPFRSTLRAPGVPAPHSIRCRAPRFGLPPPFASFAPGPDHGSVGVHPGVLRLIGHPFAPLSLFTGGEGLSLPSNAWLFVVLALFELGQEPSLLALFLEALERAFEGLVGLDDDLGHSAPLQVATPWINNNYIPCDLPPGNRARPSGGLPPLAAPAGALPVYTVVPVVAMLLAIAICPLWVPGWWESNRNKMGVSAALGLPILVLYMIRRPGALGAMAAEYVSFIVLLAGLYVVAGGILLRGDLQATPLTNTAFLALGSVLASLVGTTGASMLLIRPLLQTNRERTRVRHTVIFFIFLVSNIGGMLTPLGDPPLFLGYLQGVPFTWTFRLWPHWAFQVVLLLALYLAWDTRQYVREPIAALRRDRAQIEPLRLQGAINVVWLALVVLAVALLREPWREVLIVTLAVVSLWMTPRAIREANGFTFHPIVEVAVLFFGIFLTMIPALEILRLRGGELGLYAPWQFFWASGILSSFLDNAPTYLTFLALAQGLGLAREVVDVPHVILAAISVGAVSMGANSYIGNAPNFMVRSIAEEQGVKMPSFLGYMAYSGVILLPLFALVTLVFF